MRFGSCTFVLAMSFAVPAFGKTVSVANVDQLRAAIAQAVAGDEVIVASGTYRLGNIPCAAEGTAIQPIVVRAAVPLAAKIEFTGMEGFQVRGAHWHFEDLDIRGVCANDDTCEHAFHVTGAASGFVLRGNRIFDFNAQLKVNSEMDRSGTWTTPHAGIIEGNEIGDSRARATGNPTTKLNIDTGDGWIVRANYIHDAHKAGGDYISYAAFMKSGGSGGLFERNLVICSKDDTTGGTRIGLSLGGGGTAPRYCAPAFDANGSCDPEHTNGIIRNNIIVNCSDVGIYLNKAKNTKVLYNTLIATSGVDFRFTSSTGEADGNVLAGKIRTRDGGTFVAKNNLTDLSQFDAWYMAPMAGDLRKKGDLGLLLAKGSPRSDLTTDYCARTRSQRSIDLGALESSLGECTTTRPPLVGPTPAPDAGVVDAGPITDGSLAADGSSPRTDASDGSSASQQDGSSALGDAASRGDADAASGRDQRDAVAGGDAAWETGPGDGQAQDTESSGCGCRLAGSGSSASTRELWGVSWLLGMAALRTKRRLGRSKGQTKASRA